MTSNKRQLFISWFLLTLFFITHYFIRVSPSLLSTSFMKDFSILPGKVGQISSGYFLFYTFAQLPAAYLIRRWPINVLISIVTMISALCTIGIAMASSFHILLSCYLLFAFCAAFSFLGAVTFVSQYLPQYQSILFALTQSFGMAAGFAATNIITSAIQNTAWRHIIMQTSWALFGTSILIALFTQTGHSSCKKSYQNNTISPSAVLSSPQTWLNALYIGSAYFPVMILIEGGIGPNMLSILHPNNTPLQIAFGISLTFIGWMVGGPISGFLSDQIGHLLLMRIAALSSAIIASFILYIPLTTNILYLVLFLFGASNTGLLGAYSVAADMHGKDQAALSLSITSMSSTLIGAILCGILPSILELSCEAIWVDGLPVYAATSYRHIFSCMIYIPLFALLCTFFIKERKRTFNVLSTA